MKTTPCLKAYLFGYVMVYLFIDSQQAHLQHEVRSISDSAGGADPEQLPGQRFHDSLQSSLRLCLLLGCWLFALLQSVERRLSTVL